MWPFRRKPKGRHALGAAVTSIPSVVQPVAPAVPAYVPPPLPPEPVVPVVPVVPQPEPPAAPEPRVELGFRDGSTAALAPGSAQAKALTEIASILTHRD
jgi:hypothetical protein